MRNVRKNLAFLAVLVMFVAVAGVALGANGREFSRCVRQCNSEKSQCNSACLTDCKALCNNVTSCVTPCVSNCKNTTCLPADDACKLMCQSVKNPPSPTEP